jgi:hypothetical protein
MLLETALNEIEEVPSQLNASHISFAGDEVFGASLIRILMDCEDPTVQYLILELIISTLGLCRSGEINGYSFENLANESQ